ncbi:THO complex subunit 5 [Oratosquilla oratoria]|uniref:THO complex subunit 5 n=1 Tax=Oratosquilla oratoria TaxID=337810 RepID=UPI003F765A01
MGRGQGDIEGEGREPKRRRRTVDGAKKLPTAGSAATAEPASVPTTQTPRPSVKEKEKHIIHDTYQANLEHEAEEANRRTEAEDQELFHKTCDHVRQLMNEILNLKTEKPEGWTRDVDERRVQVLVLMLTLRRLSRVQKVRVRESRDRTGEQRQRVDGVTLRLQNLLYEVSHLKKEVRKCLEFQSADEEIDLVPVEQFYKEAPDSISRPEDTVEEPHQQRLARLHWELEQRRGQTQLFDQLTQEKEAVAATIAEQEKKLASLAPRINTILEATKPLQDALELPLDTRREQQRMGRLLPTPLYTVWVQAGAYGEACDNLVHVEIRGDAEAARKLIAVEEESKVDTNSDSDLEQESAEENSNRKKRNRRDQKMDSDESSEVRQILSLHPLHVNVTIKTKNSSSVVIAFHYLQNLRIVTTKCSLQLAEKTRPNMTDVISGDAMLNCLFDGDDGTTSPNPATIYQLQRTRINLKDYLSTVGRPYLWAQTLAGLVFTPAKNKGGAEDLVEGEGSSNHCVTAVPPPSTEQVCSQLSAEHMHITIKSIRRRLQSRVALQTQLLALEGANSTSAIPVPGDFIRQHFPGKVCSDLRSWQQITWSDYESLPSTQMLREAFIVTPQHLFFKAVFERKHVKLEAFAAVSPNHPVVAPVFSLRLFWDGQHDSATDPHIRQMEAEVNIYWNELVSSHNDRLELLPLQLYRIAMCLDLYTEATSAHMDANGPDAEFHKEKIFFRPARGPDRAYPFKYLPKLGVFTQR